MEKIVNGGGKKHSLRNLCFVFSFLFVLCFFLTGCGESSDSGTIWFSGSDFSSATSAKAGDFFLDTDDGFVYRYVSGSWIYIMCLKGSDGESGQDGTNAYIHIVYSAYSDGTNNGVASFSSTWSSGCTYIGIYSGTEETAPSEASAYQWILISYESSTETVTTYTITYVLNGGTNSSSNPSTYTSASSSFTLASPTRDGYNFGGWYSDSSLTTRVTTITSSTGNITLYAKWTEAASGTVNVDVTSAFEATWVDSTGIQYANGAGGSSTSFRYGTCDVSAYVGCYLTITMPVYTVTAGTACPYGLAFYNESTVGAAYYISGIGISQETVPEGYSSITEVSDRSTTRTVETITIQIPEGAVLVASTYYRSSFTAYTYSGSFSAVITSEAP